MSSQNIVPSSVSTVSIAADSRGSVEEDIDELQKSFVFPFFSEMSRDVVIPSFFFNSTIYNTNFSIICCKFVYWESSYMEINFINTKNIHLFFIFN